MCVVALADGPTLYSKPVNFCFNLFLITTIVLGALAVLSGLYAILECKGILQGFLGTRHFAVMGQVNAFALTVAGAVLFILGSLALSYHYK